jgi:hypothetical protein
MRPRACSRRSETVTMPAPQARTALASTCGEGYCAVPISMREGSSTPYSASALLALADGSGAFMISAQPPCRGDTISMRSPACSAVAARARSGTKSPLRAVAIRVPARPRSATRSANVAASVANGSPLTRMARLTRALLTFTAPFVGLRARFTGAQFNRLRPQTSSAPGCPRALTYPTPGAMNIAYKDGAKFARIL